MAHPIYVSVGIEGQFSFGHGPFRIVDVEGPYPSTTYFEQIGLISRILEREATFRLGMLTDIAASLLENIE